MKKKSSIKNFMRKIGKETLTFWKFQNETLKISNRREIKAERMRQKRTWEYYSKDFLAYFGWVPGKRVEVKK